MTSPAPLPPIPFEQPELGTFAATLTTIRGVLLSPSTFFARPATDASLLRAAMLAMLLQIPFGLASGAIQVTQTLAHPDFPNATPLPLIAVGQVVGLILYPLIAAIFAGGHFVLLFVVGAREHRYLDLLRAQFLLHAVGLIYVVLAPIGIVLEIAAPSGGLLVFLLWAVIAEVYVVLAVARTARTAVWRAILAQLIPMALCCCLPVGSFGVWQYVRRAEAAHAPTVTTPVAP